MSVLVEALTVVFRNTTANMKLKGESGSLCDIAPNETYRTDGFLSAVGFMNPRDAKYFVDQLEAIGLFLSNKNRRLILQSAIKMKVLHQRVIGLKQKRMNLVFVIVGY